MKLRMSIHLSKFVLLAQMTAATCFFHSTRDTWPLWMPIGVNVKRWHLPQAMRWHLAQASHNEGKALPSLSMRKYELVPAMMIRRLLDFCISDVHMTMALPRCSRVISA